MYRSIQVYAVYTRHGIWNRSASPQGDPQGVSTVKLLVVVSYNKRDQTSLRGVRATFNNYVCESC